MAEVTPTNSLESFTHIQTTTAVQKANYILSVANIGKPKGWGENSFLSADSFSSVLQVIALTQEGQGQEFSKKEAR